MSALRQDVEKSIFEGVLEQVALGDFSSPHGKAAFIGPHASKLDLYQFWGKNSDKVTAWDTKGGKMIREQGWLADDSPLSLGEKQALCHAVQTAFLQKASGALTIVGVDAKYAGDKHYHYNLLRDGLSGNGEVVTINGELQGIFFRRYERDAGMSLYVDPDHPRLNERNRVIRKDAGFWKRRRNTTIAAKR